MCSQAFVTLIESTPKEIARQARDPNNITTSVEQLRELGKTAIHIDDAFITVSRAFETLVRDYGEHFPGSSNQSGNR